MTFSLPLSLVNEHHLHFSAACSLQIHFIRFECQLCGLSGFSQGHSLFHAFSPSAKNTCFVRIIDNLSQIVNGDRSYIGPYNQTLVGFIS